VALRLIREAKCKLRPYRDQTGFAYPYLLDAEGQVWKQAQDATETAAALAAPVVAKVETGPVVPSEEELEWFAKPIYYRHNRPLADWIEYAKDVWAGKNFSNAGAHAAAKVIRTLGYAVDVKYRQESAFYLEIRRTADVITPTELDRRTRIAEGTALGLEGEPSWDEIGKKRDALENETARRRWARRFNLDPDDPASTWERIEELDERGEIENAELYRLYREAGDWDDPVDDEPDDDY
jgi:hypothetical protein